jgi:hypothetical protein
MRAKEFLPEAIPLSQYKDVVKQAGWYTHGKKIDYKARYADIFGRAMRLYFPVEGASANDMPASHAGSGVMTSITNLLAVGGYTQINFKTNSAVDKHGRTVRLGKAATATIAQIDKNNKGDVFWDQFVDNSKRAYAQWERNNQAKAKDLQSKANDVMVVISRHPYDVAGMSTGRDWVSCMNLNTGANKQFIPMDIAYGTIIAYLTRIDDKDLKNPLARVLIKPFINVNDETQKVFGIESKTYPPEAKSIPGWLDIVRTWVDGVNKNAIDGKYELVSGMYQDDMDGTIYKGQQ